MKFGKQILLTIWIGQAQHNTIGWIHIQLPNSASEWDESPWSTKWVNITQSLPKDLVKQLQHVQLVGVEIHQKNLDPDQIRKNPINIVYFRPCTPSFQTYANNLPYHRPILSMVEVTESDAFKIFQNKSSTWKNFVRPLDVNINKTALEEEKFYPEWITDSIPEFLSRKILSQKNEGNTQRRIDNLNHSNTLSPFTPSESTFNPQSSNNSQSPTNIENNRESINGIPFFKKFFSPFIAKLQNSQVDPTTKINFHDEYNLSDIKENFSSDSSDNLTPRNSCLSKNSEWLDKRKGAFYSKRRLGSSLIGHIQKSSPFMEYFAKSRYHDAPYLIYNLKFVKETEIRCWFKINSPQELQNLSQATSKIDLVIYFPIKSNQSILVMQQNYSGVVYDLDFIDLDLIELKIFLNKT